MTTFQAVFCCNTVLSNTSITHKILKVCKLRIDLRDHACTDVADRSNFVIILTLVLRNLPFLPIHEPCCQLAATYQFWIFCYRFFGPNFTRHPEV